MTTFTFYHHDFGDDTQSVWVAAYVDGAPDKRIGAYVGRDGAVALNDQIEWRVERDLENMGIATDSDAAVALVREWVVAAKVRGLALLESRD